MFKGVRSPSAADSHSHTEVLATVADYANAAAWTPAVRTASKLSPPGPLAVGTIFAQEIDIGGASAQFTWRVSRYFVAACLSLRIPFGSHRKTKKFEPPLSVVLKGKAKVDMHQWFWPARIKGACKPALLRDAAIC